MEHPATNPSPTARNFASRFLLRATLLVIAAGLAATLAQNPFAQALTRSPQTPTETCAVEGTVRDSAGKPVADATVTLVAASAEGGAQKNVTTKTDALGNLSFSALRAGKFTIQATLLAQRDGANVARTSPTQTLELSAGEKKHM